MLTKIKSFLIKRQPDHRERKLLQMFKSESEISGILSQNVDVLLTVPFLLDSRHPTWNALGRNGVL